MRARLPKYAAEAAGTFWLVFAGAGAAAVEAQTGALGHLGVSLVFGLVVAAMVYAVGHVSGAHINPAVSVGFWAAGRLPSLELPPYAAAQLAGAAAAGLLLRVLFPELPGALGATLPSGSASQSFLLEAVLSAGLMFVIMGVATDHRAVGTMAGVAIGATVGWMAAMGGPVSGASMNPARSFGPALAAGVTAFQWIYWLAPPLGAAAGALLYEAVRCEVPLPSKAAPDGPGCC